ncbi:hypothetical protein KI387_008520, partial [Taxus chinensis]
FTAGGSSTSYRIRVWRGGCRGYTSVLNYNPALPLNQWMYGVEIMCVAPRIVAGACVVFIVAILAVVFYRRKRLQMEIQARLARERAEILAVNSGGKSAKLFTIKEIHKATNGFAGDRLLGVGGFGEVYKGILKDGTTVAVKMAKVGNIKGTEQVLNEVRILSQVNHRSL